jgi:hypothetical protein
MKRNLSSLLFFSLFLALTMFAYGQNEGKVDAVKYFDENKRWYNEYTEHWFSFFDIPENQIRDSIIHWEKIGADIEGSNDDWTGTFATHGETHGSYFRWSQRNGFIWLSVNKCVGGPMRITRGRVVVQSNMIKLFPEIVIGKKHSGHGEQDKAPKQINLLFVKWLNVPFLVNENEISSFADFTVGLGDYNDFYSGILGHPFFQKLGAEANDNPNELPIFPSGYEKFVKKPVKGEITSIGKTFRRPDPHEFNREEWENSVTQALVNIGRAQGAVRNLRLFYVNAKNSPIEELRIVKVGVNSSLIEISRSVRKKNCVVSEHNDCENHEYEKIKVGLKVSTTGH